MLVTVATDNGKSSQLEVSGCTASPAKDCVHLRTHLDLLSCYISAQQLTCSLQFPPKIRRTGRINSKSGRAGAVLYC